MQIKKRPPPVLSSDGLILFSSSYFFLVNNALIFAPRVLKKFPMLQHFVKGYGEIILFRIRNKTAFLRYDF